MLMFRRRLAGQQLHGRSKIRAVSVRKGSFLARVFQNDIFVGNLFLFLFYPVSRP